MVAVQVLLMTYSLLGLHTDQPINNEVLSPDGSTSTLLCPYGCTQCSPVNGCLACKPPYYLLLLREGHRQIALCRKSCPKGFYKMRRKKKRGFCGKCVIRGCSECSNRHFCSECKPGWVRYAGRCHKQCPPGTTVGPRYPRLCLPAPPTYSGAPATPICPNGCKDCSKNTGCQQFCPRGFYWSKKKSKNLGICEKCHIRGCQECSTRHHCATCLPDYVRYGGQCHKHCPLGTALGPRFPGLCLPQQSVLSFPLGKDGLPLKPYSRLSYNNDTTSSSTFTLSKNGKNSSSSSTSSNSRRKSHRQRSPSNSITLSSDTSRRKNSTLSKSGRRRNRVFALSRNSSTVVRPDPGGGEIPEKRRRRKKKSRQKNRDRKVKRKERRRHKNGRRRDRRRRKKESKKNDLIKQ